MREHPVEQSVDRVLSRHDQRNILFVNHEPNILHGLQRMLHSMRRTWRMTFSDDPRQALDLLTEGRFDVVVSDMQMPGMAGTQFLGEVMRRHPHVVRIILTGRTDRETTMEALLVSHQLLAKPCSADALKATICRALALRGLLDGDTPLKALVSRLETLPSVPDLYSQIVEELQSPNASVKVIAEIVAQDPAMTAKILQLVNSAYFGLSRHISNLNRAVNLLGLETIKALVLTAQVFSRFDPDTVEAFDVDSLWGHSTVVGALSRAIADAEDGDEELLSDALTAGLLHDVGKLLLAVNLPNIHAKVMTQAIRDGVCLTEAERCLFGAAHGETGAYLLGLWGLPESIVEAVAYHHQPHLCETPGFTALTAVHMANALAHELSLDPRLSTPDPVDQGYLESLGLDHRLDHWRGICLRLLRQ